MFKKLLIANRGEIVNRIINTCEKMGIKTVVIYSEADKNATYIRRADEAYNIGPANPMKSYLNIDEIVKVLKISNADAVHPGYGFLSENSSFANVISELGASWIGPSPKILEEIESKCYCREIANDVGVPVVPGSDKLVSSVDEILDIANSIGYPILLKLDKGGGGKGIEIAENGNDIKNIFERLCRVGTLAFASSDCYVEKAIKNPRHIEIQFIMDQFGKCVCLGERECSIQRRYQKIIEESPSPVVIQEDRERLYDYTKKLASKMQYKGAGTMEFIRDESGKFYFIEVNARLQVEHPVSEFVTGMDIVENQIRIACGEKIDFTQDDIKLNGHSIECRVYAEDPVKFIPSPGTIQDINFPTIDSKYLRIEHALEKGSVVPPYYDPMLAKVISWGQNRDEAIKILVQALNDFKVEGIKTNISVNLNILKNQKYISGDFDTSFISSMNAVESTVEV
ncbi:acetyl/propionyl/methylcrotonyl-CoA carboxylase subunit alpha [Clostridium sp. WILCCON 0269]|uniref:Acetyl/propionyl/methylcrotonyl-CoA carboxylase subunit alpha n=1 Tax=Candidatus Clostridium eludens TaxID=3381663 RepID=A0ABW8SFM0_9CLOT